MIKVEAQGAGQEVQSSKFFLFRGAIAKRNLMFCDFNRPQSRQVGTAAFQPAGGFGYFFGFAELDPLKRVSVVSRQKSQDKRSKRFGKVSYSHLPSCTLIFSL
jgi:hypothetical protein